jgi:hypothetical protein
VLCKSLILLALLTNSAPSFAQQVTLVCKSTVYTFNPNSAINSPPIEKDDVTFTFNLRDKKVTFLEGDSYIIDSLSPSVITWHDGPRIQYTFNRDSLTGREIAHFGDASLTYAFAPCKLMTHRF